MPVRESIDGNVLTICIDRPERRNAIDSGIAAGLDAALNRLDDDPRLWVGILTGTSTMFSAGTDLVHGSGAPTARGGEYGLMRRRRHKPLVAAVEGWAAGGGFELALACDLIVASTASKFALPEARRGLVATAGGLFRGPRALPLNIAREMLLTGLPLDAERAYSLGVVNQLAAPGDALAVATRLARQICEASPVAVQETLRALDDQTEAADAEGWRVTARAWGVVGASDDRREGVAAFLSKRKPSWRGR